MKEEVALPRAVYFCLFAAALQNGALAGTPAHAEMTKADKAGTEIFVACLNENSGDEDTCLEKLGRIAWYPRDNRACEIIGARVERVIELDGFPVYRDLFHNERCARLGLPHGATAAAAGDRLDSFNPWVRCDDSSPSPYLCEEQFGRHVWHPKNGNHCVGIKRGVTRETRENEFVLHNFLFWNERCRRLGMVHFLPGAPP